MEDDRNLELTMTSSKVFSDEETRYCLRVVFSPAREVEGRFIPLEHGGMVVGRAESKDAGALISGDRLGVPDPRISRSHARFAFEPDTNTASIEDLNSKNGTWLNGARLSRRTLLAPQDVVRVGDTLFVCCRLRWPPEDQAEERAGIVGVSAALGEVRRRIAELAPSCNSVLITGESGTGKELVARGLHDLSDRTGPFVAVNSSAIPKDLFESELFGVRKGAFSGADRDREGLLVAARKGTLFLDEIGDMPPGAQAKLLRAVEELEVTPLGTTTPVKVDVRFVAATNADMDAAVGGDGFRTDLFHRLTQSEISIPPLRERKEDIPVIWEHFLERDAIVGRAREATLVEALLVYPWHGNVRELKNVAAELSIRLGAKATATLKMLPHKVRDHLHKTKKGTAAVRLESSDWRLDTHRDRPAPATPVEKRVVWKLAKGERPTRRALVDSLTRHRGNLAAVAEEFNRKRPQAYRWLKHYDIDPDEFR